VTVAELQLRQSTMAFTNN